MKILINTRQIPNADKCTEEYQSGRAQFSLRGLLFVITVIGLLLGLAVEFGQAAAVLGALSAGLLVSLFCNRLRRSYREILLAVCAASLAGLTVATAGLWRTLFGFWLISFGEVADALRIAPPVACALITGVGLLCIRTVVIAVVYAPPRWRVYAAVALVGLFIIPNAIVLKTITDSLWAEADWPLYYRMLLIVVNVSSIATNIILLKIILGQAAEGSREAAASSAVLLFLFDLWALALWGWPFVEGI